MEITEVRVKLVNVKNDKLRAFCSITLDNDFVIRDLKVIEGTKGAFVAMPSRKLSGRCPRCGGKNHYRARFCNDCGARLSPDRFGRLEGGNQKLHTDIAHPINSKCREVIQKKVLEVYQEEAQKATQPGYKPMELEVFDEEALVEEAEYDETSETAQEMGAGEPAFADSGAPAAGQDLAGAAGGSPGAGHASARGPSHGQGRDRGGREGDRHQRRQEHGRGRFRRGHRRQKDGSRGGREGGRGGQRHGEGGRRGGDGQWRSDRAHPARSESQGPGIPEKDREHFLPDAAPVGSADPSIKPSTSPVRREEPEPEPEDNFGAGLFS